MEEKEVILEIEDSIIPCQKNILIENSEYFRAMFSGNFLESQQNTIKIKDIDLHSMNNILMLLWDPTYVIREGDLLSLLQASLMLQFPKIQKFCEHRILENLKPSNCLKVWKYIDQQIHPLDLKAKCMALEEFSEICDTEQIMELNFDEICVYLGHTNLRVDSELTVFQTAMKWWYENSKNYDDIKPTDAILKLLHCIDFKNVTVENINEMKAYPDICDNGYIQSLLNCLQCLKQQSDSSQFPEEHQMLSVKFLNESKERVVFELPCIILEPLSKFMERNKHFFESLKEDHQSDVFFRDVFGRKRKHSATSAIDLNSQSMFGFLFDPTSETLKNCFSIDEYKCKGLTGFQILTYKEFILLFGGEVSFGNGNWNNNLWMFDTFRDKWERRTVLPYCRRHFEACIAGSVLYVVGGTGQYRIVQDNLFFYNIKKDKWSGKITLPCPSRQLKCCSFHDKLFILSLDNQCGYIFDEKSQNFKSIALKKERGKVQMEGEYDVFFWKEDFYIIGNVIVKFKMKDNKLVFQRAQKVELDVDMNFFSSVICCDILYIVSSCGKERQNLGILKLKDLSDFDDCIGNLKTINLSEHIFPCVILKLCSFHHYNTVKNNVLINEF